MAEIREPAVDDASAAESPTEASPDVDAAGQDTPVANAEEQQQDPKGKGPMPRRWLRSAMRWTAIAVFVAVLVGAGYEGWLLFQQHQKRVAAAQALDAAQKYAVTLTSTDPDAVDQNFTDILSGATGDFKDMYTKAGSRLRKMLIDNKVATQGSVVDSAVKAATTNKVEVLLFVKQSVSNSASPEPRTDLTAVTITMEKVNGRWLAGKVVLPAEQG